ncbi:reticulon-4-interacting protein 1, mitochondrial-like [Planococcus citri]|uniref:reticulon-4-interacting protein 1, mitochondrial-like n=1 Tax=Planococcus citri TaxID=170843 RepID=UPI0031F8E6A3
MGEIPSSMSAWQVLDYSGTIHYTSEAPVPKIINPREVLVKVTSSSINIIDWYMTEGYGHVLLNFIKKILHFFSGYPSHEFPATLGRDFVGKVVAVGSRVNPMYEIGTIVMGLAPPPRDGSHAEYVVVNQKYITKKPDEIKDEEAAAVLYAGVTAWSALNIGADLWFREKKNKKVLVIGASGGVGTVAIQLLKSWGTSVVATCSSNAIPLVQRFRPEKIIDYTESSFFDELREWGPYDIILDAANIGEAQIPNYICFLKSFKCAKYITLQPPILPETDRYGVFFGLLKTLYDFIAVNVVHGSLLTARSISYGIFIPMRGAIEELATLMKQKKLHAVIDSEFPFAEASAAYDRVKQGHLRGKVILKH